ncbi:MAG: EcsC family protein, partial [Lentisphaeria bacterium]|nr:EcsC family protein [Lentisphaeria bacterium]
MTLTDMTENDYQDLRKAVYTLENPGFTAAVADLIGTPIEKVMKLLPAKASKSIDKVTEAALQKALNLAVFSMKEGKTPASPGLHKFAAAASGAIGGAAGLPGLAIELPITTTIIFRSIADIARAEGEDLTDPFASLACLEVLAYGGRSDNDDAVDSCYFATRVALAHAVKDAAQYIVKGIVQKEAAPMLVQLISKIAARFGIVVSYKAAAQMAPVIGALGGAVVNTMFMDHFQSMAKGHFTVRRLERV